MANIFTKGSPLIVTDAAAAIIDMVANGILPAPIAPKTAGGVVVANAIYVTKIVWEAPAAVGNQFQIVDGNGRERFHAIAGANDVGSNVEFDFPADAQGHTDLALTQNPGWRPSLVDSGTVRIYFRL